MNQIQTGTNKDSATVDRHQYNVGRLLSDAKDEDLDIFVDGSYMMALRDEYHTRAQESAREPQNSSTPTTMEVYKEGVNKNDLTQPQLNIGNLWRSEGDKIMKEVNVGSEDQEKTDRKHYNIGSRLSRLKSHELAVFKDLRYMVKLRDYYQHHRSSARDTQPKESANTSQPPRQGANKRPSPYFGDLPDKN